MKKTLNAWLRLCLKLAQLMVTDGVVEVRRFPMIANEMTEEVAAPS